VERHKGREAEERAETTLARELMLVMERLDPSGDTRTWEQMTSQERLFYESCISHLLGFEELLSGILRLPRS
jgi:hypothetical protein